METEAIIDTLCKRFYKGHAFFIIYCFVVVIFGIISTGTVQAETISRP